MSRKQSFQEIASFSNLYSFSTKASPVHHASTIVQMNPNNVGDPLVSSSGENPVVKVIRVM